MLNGSASASLLAISFASTSDCNGSVSDPAALAASAAAFASTSDCNGSVSSSFAARFHSHQSSDCKALSRSPAADSAASAAAFASMFDCNAASAVSPQQTQQHQQQRLRRCLIASSVSSITGSRLCSISSSVCVDVCIAK